MSTKTKAEHHHQVVFFISFFQLFIYYSLLPYTGCLTKSTLKFESKFEVQKVKKTFLFDCLYSNNDIFNNADKIAWEQRSNGVLYLCYKRNITSQGQMCLKYELTICDVRFLY